MLVAMRGRRVPTLARRLARRAHRLMLELDLRDAELSLVLVSDRVMHELNRTWRGKDRPTDVLAFAQREGPAGAIHPGLLGDIVISIDTARRQARRGLYAELLHLASHGLCHLLGYDHRTDAEEADMNARAAALRAEARRRGRVHPA